MGANSISSIVPMSAVNRLRIRPDKKKNIGLLHKIFLKQENSKQASIPDELTLKKYMVDLMIALNMLLCKFSEVFMKNDTSTAHLTKMNPIMEMFKTA